MKIALIGSKGSGKSVVASFLTREYGIPEYAIATPLKQIAQVIGFTEEELHKSKTSISPSLGICSREFLQVFGTEFGRSFQRYFPNSTIQSLWIHLLDRVLSTTDTLCISDVRFPDELKTVRNYPNTIVIKIIRPGVEEDSYSSHESESYIDSMKPDHILYNDRGVEDLERGVACILRLYKYL